MSAKIRCETHQFPIGQTIIRQPVTIKSGESAILDFSGTWSHEAVKHLLEEHAGKEEVNVELTEILLDINGVRIRTNETLKIPNFPVM